MSAWGQAGHWGVGRKGPHEYKEDQKEDMG